MIRSYLPDRSSQLPALVGQKERESDFSSEREILYKVLFDMKKDMLDLKKLVAEIIQNNGNGTQLSVNPQALNQLYTDIELQPTAAELHGSSTLTIHKPGTEPQHFDILQHEEEEESLSLIDKESDLIKKALKKHRGKRKLAAQELGISERTLYRKIKEFKLDNITNNYVWNDIFYNSTNNFKNYKYLPKNSRNRVIVLKIKLLIQIPRNEN